MTGSHLDSVPGGGAFDGPLGVATALVAFDRLATDPSLRTVPRAIAVFPEEEGSRFGLACLGSRLLTGAVHPDRVLGLRDAAGDTAADVLRAAGTDPEHLGMDRSRLSEIGAFIELHVEQGRGLIDRGAAVGVATSVLGHGRWRLTFHGEGNHAGSTLMGDRRDPMLPAAAVVAAVRHVALRHPGGRATVGRLVPSPGGTNVIAGRVDLWLDARHEDDAVTLQMVREIGDAARSAAADEGCVAELVEESLSATVGFDGALRETMSAALGGAPALATGAGHDAAVLSAHVPTGMLFVRNPTGVSHSEHEHVEDSDAEAGAEALADVLRAAVRRPARA